MARVPVLGIVGPGADATPADIAHAESLGALAAARGWIVLNGGVASGVMEAASRGARRAGGVVIGILPTSDDTDASSSLTVALRTGMGQARNNVIVLSSDAIAVCGMSPGTAVEVALAVRAQRPVVCLAATTETRAFFTQIDAAGVVRYAVTANEAIALLHDHMPRP
jgi:uncharacterized protein (TIGR00725 family)